MKIETWPIDRPKDYPKNARKWSARAIETVAASIKAYGWRQPIVVDSEDVIVIGHLRRAAGKSLGLQECPVHVAADLTPEQIRGLRLADNRTSEESAWDLDLLRVEMGELKVAGFDLSLTGFTTREVDGFTLAANPAEDEVPPVPENPVTRLGDLWLLGPHRVLCGDATNASDVTILLAGVKTPVLMVTDPPYGVDYDPNWRNEAAEKGLIQFGATRVAYMPKGSDKEAAWADVHRLFPGDVAYVWHAGLHAREVAEALNAAGFEIRCQIIWRKARYAISRGHYNYQHEPCWYAVRKGKTAHWQGANNLSTVWDVATIEGNEAQTLHAAQKPVELMRRSILNHTKEGDATYDAFLGSGTMIIAAELTKRICYGLELAPQHCDVIVTRWQNITGKQATLDGDGRTFAEVQAERCAVAVSSESDGRETEVPTDAGRPGHSESDGSGGHTPGSNRKVHRRVRRRSQDAAAPLSPRA